MQFLRQAHSQGAGAGRPAPEAKYLGCRRRSYGNGNEGEIEFRARGAFHGYASMGRFWKGAAGFCTETVLDVLIFRNMVHEALLSGLESLMLAPSEVHSQGMFTTGTKILDLQAVATKTTNDIAQPNMFAWQSLQLAPCHRE